MLINSPKYFEDFLFCRNILQKSFLLIIVASGLLKSCITEEVVKQMGKSIHLLSVIIIFWLTTCTVNQGWIYIIIIWFLGWFKTDYQEFLAFQIRVLFCKICHFYLKLIMENFFSSQKANQVMNKKLGSYLCSWIGWTMKGLSIFWENVLHLVLTLTGVH